jgi:DNA-binding response OmpR family regulator
VELVISEIERRFLEIMVDSAGQVVGRETLIAAFSADDIDYDPHRLDSLISRLRKRTEEAGLGNLPLQSIRGTGYIFTKCPARAERRSFTR